MRKADWYFDFLSPFAYLQNCRLDEFPSNLFINRKPLLFAGLLSHWGTKGPVELSAKRLFTYRHVQWLADQMEVPLRFPEKHPLTLFHCFVFALQQIAAKKQSMQFLIAYGLKDYLVMILTTGKDFVRL